MQDAMSGREPTVLVQLSDLHLRAGDEWTGPASRLARAVRLVKDLEPRPSAVLVTGDLADEPSEAVYEQAYSLLAALGLPLHAVPGNHDDRDLMRARFGAPEEPDAPVRFAADCGPLRLIGCDSTIPGSDAGALGDEQLAWLDATLASAPDTPTLLALHHPPVRTGIRVMDLIALSPSDSARLEEIVGGHPQVRTITCGHAHTAMTTSFAGRALLVCPSTNSTVRLDLRPCDDLPFTVAKQPPGYAVHALIGDRLVSHIQPV
jgi:3',5'-cyclic AMP phosphodiesterase CpdA